MKPTLSSLVLLSAITLLGNSKAHSQEKMRIDSETVSVVASPWKLMEIDSKASLRGLHVLDERNIWVSGSQGTIINSRDGGTTWKIQTVKGAEELDFRDIHAIDEGTIVAMTSGTPARIYRSTNGGISWKICFENKDPKIFLDALSFWDDQNGIVMGDPVNKLLLLLRTRDAGRTWTVYKSAPSANPGEAGFAASGTNAIAVGKKKYMVALGGAEENQSKKTSRVLYTNDRGEKWYSGVVPMPRSPSGGIFSICFANDKEGVAVGGDYKQADATAGNYATTSDGGKTWTTRNPRVPPSGYRSGVAVSVKGKEVRIVAVGPNGTDQSTDLGNKWRRISNEGFHAVDFSPNGKVGFASGANGRIARWVEPPVKPQK